jgi:hypothetical protein
MQEQIGAGISRISRYLPLGWHTGQQRKNYLADGL